MALLSLPTELLSHIRAHVASPHTLNALARVNRRLYAVFNPLLYQQDAQCDPSAAISWAAEHGKIGTLKKSLSYGAEVPVYSAVGKTSDGAERMFHGKEIPKYFNNSPAHPLCLAVENGYADIVELLVGQGCDVNMRNLENFSLLCVAVIYHHAHLVKTLLSLGARQDSSGFKNIYSPIQLAVFHADNAAVELLLHHGSNSSRPTSRQMEDAFECALHEHHRHLIQPLLDSKVDLNFHFKDRRTMDTGTPLLWAVEKEDIELVKLFLNRGADPNFIPRYNKPALIRAVERNQEELVRLLVCGTHRIQQTQALACSMNYPDGHIAKILLENGTITDFKEGDHAPSSTIKRPDECNLGEPEEESALLPPLIRAVSLRNANLVQLLVEHGANVNVGCWEFIKTLSRHFIGGPLLLAMNLGDQDIVGFLRGHGAEEEVETPLTKFAATLQYDRFSTSYSAR